MNKEILDKLINRYKNKLLTNALIFSGIKGIGKKSVALRLAKEILKTDKELKNHPDFYLLEKEKSIKVEDILNISSYIYEKPMISKNKVVIIDDAIKMNIESQNKFLKTYEQLPSYAYLILISSNDIALLDTIKSRAQFYYFNPLNKKDIFNYLIKNHDEEISKFASAFSLGSLLRAEKIAKKEIEYQIINNIYKLFECIKNKDNLGIYTFLKEYNYNPLILEFSIYYIRDILLLKNDRKAKNLNFIKFTDKLVELSEFFSYNELNTFINKILEANKYINANCTVKIVMFNLFIDIGGIDERSSWG